MTSDSQLKIMAIRHNVVHRRLLESSKKLWVSNAACKKLVSYLNLCRSCLTLTRSVIGCA